MLSECCACCACMSGAKGENKEQFHYTMHRTQHTGYNQFLKMPPNKVGYSDDGSGSSLIDNGNGRSITYAIVSHYHHEHLTICSFLH